MLGAIQWPVIVSQLSAIGAVVTISVIGLLLNVSGLQLAPHYIDLNQELRAALFERVRQRTLVVDRPRLRFVLLDFRLVPAIDSTALLSFSKLQQLGEAQDLVLVFTQLRRTSASSSTRHSSGSRRTCIYFLLNAEQSASVRRRCQLPATLGVPLIIHATQYRFIVTFRDADFSHSVLMRRERITKSGSRLGSR